MTKYAVWMVTQAQGCKQVSTAWYGLDGK